MKDILLETESELQSYGTSEFSLNANNTQGNAAVSLDLREETFEAITHLKEKLRIVNT